MSDISEKKVNPLERIPGISKAISDKRTDEMAVARVLVEVAKARPTGPGQSTLEATCSRVDDLIDAYEGLLNGNGGLFDGIVDIIPGMRQDIEGKLHDAQEFKEQVCDPAGL